MYKITSNNRIKEIKKKDLIFDIINLKKFKNIFVICDSIIQKKHSKHDIFKSNFHIINIDSPEISKNFKTVSDIIKQLSKNNATRDTLLIGLGGGAITDIVGFVASIYMRGIEHIFIPTTLLSMVDASIGGKTGINFQNIKNLVGTFKTPNAIYIDIDFLSTLKKDIIIDGFSEIITDITSSGETLKANNLRVLDDGIILKSSANIFKSNIAEWNSSSEKLCNEFIDILT